MIRFSFLVCVLVVVTLGRHIDQTRRGKDVSEVKVGNNPITPCVEKDCRKLKHHVLKSNQNHHKIRHRRRNHGRKGHRKLPKANKFQLENQGSWSSIGFHRPTESSRLLAASSGYQLQHKNKKTLPTFQGYHFTSDNDKQLPKSGGFQLNDKHTKALPEEYKLPAEDPNVLYKNYGWDAEAKVPRGVARLEDKMHPNIRHAAKTFMDNLQTVLRKIQGQIRRVDDEYISVVTNSRDVILDVRKELQQITHENDKAYDTMLDVSQLVRFVYRRAHEQGLAGSKHAMAFTSLPEISHFKLHNQLSDSEHANYSASVTYHRVMDYKRRGIQQDESRSSITKKVTAASLSEKFRYFELYDLKQRCRLAIRKADVLATNVLIPVRKRMMKYKMSKSTISEKIHHAKYLNGLAYQSTKASRDAYQISKKYHDTAMKNKRQIRKKRSINQAHIETLVQRALRRSKQIENIAEMVQSKLSPLVFKSEAVINLIQSGTAGILTEVKAILVKMVSSLSKLDDKFDEVRVYLNDSRILESRCEELEGASSTIQCEKYGVFEGSGSGMVDDEDLIPITTIPSSTVFPEIPTNRKSTTKSSSSSNTSAPPFTNIQSYPPTSSMPKLTTTVKQATTTTTTVTPSTFTTTPIPSTDSPTTAVRTISNTPVATSKPPSNSAITTTSTTSKVTTEAAPTSTTLSIAPLTTTTPQTSTPTSTSTTSITLKTTVKPKTTTASKRPSFTPTDDSELEGSGIEVTGSGDSTIDGDFSFETTPIEMDVYRIATTKPTTTQRSTTTAAQSITPATTAQSTTTTVTAETESTPQTSTTGTTKEEGSGSTEEDFTFEENDENRTKDKKKDNSWFSWLNDEPYVLYDHRRALKEKLSKKAFDARQNSEKIHQKWMSVSVRSQDLINRWDKVNITLSYLQSYVYSARELEISWNTAGILLTKVHTSIPNRTQTLMQQSDIAVNKSENALNVINKKLDAMVQRKNEKLSKSDASEGGPAFIADLISKVQTTEQNSNEIERLRQINPSPCTSVQNTATRLRNSIAKLRSKIEKAKTVASSIPLTITLSGKDILRASVFDTTLPVSTSSSIDMCIKPAEQNMHVATFRGNSSQVYSLSLEDSKPVVKVTTVDGSELGSVTFESDLKLDNWHLLTIRRFGRTIEMRTKKLNETKEERVEDSYLPKIDSYHSPITEAIIGKQTITSDQSYFSGCIGDILVNGKVATIRKENGKLQHCNTGSCGSKNTKSMIFDGDGFVMFSQSLIDASYIDNINIEFQTLQRDAVLLFINHKHKLLQVLISLREGGIHIEVSTRRGTTVLSSKKDDYSDGKDHYMKIIFGTDVIDVSTDITDEKFEQGLVRQEIAPRIPDGIYLGGLDVKSHSLSGKTKLRSFAGCLSAVTISNKELSLPLMERSRNVYYGKCSENIWRTCVKFTDKSTPIKFPKSGDHKSVSIIFGRDSTGTLLNIQRIKGEDFDFSIIYNGKSIEISDNNEGMEYKMTSDYQDKDWHVLTVEDTDNEQLKMSFDSTVKSLPYDIPWRWGYPKLEYTIAVGGLPDSETATYLGGISAIILNDRPVKLGEMIAENNLQPCEKTFSTHLKSDMEEKPVC